MGPGMKEKEKKGQSVVAKKPKAEGGTVKDPRFEHMHYDPRFKRLGKKQTKVTIDPRFKGMLTDDRFKLNYTVDKYGRKLQRTTKDDLEQFYQLGDSDEDAEETSTKPKGKGDKSETKPSKKTKKVESGEDEDGEEGEEDSEEGEEMDKDLEEGEEEEEEEEGEESEEEPREYDPARGIGVESSSEDDDDLDDLDVDDGLEEGEEDDDVELGDETRRFAACNMDWDHIGAVDLLVVFNSFKPASGTVTRVTVLPSEFGKERMAEEDRLGPKVLRDTALPAQESSDEESEEVVEGGPQRHKKADEFDQEQLRKYQLERMKYYYAVVECDSVETATQIYKECDGQEYLNSGNVFDLRFIPDEMEFNDEPREVATEVPADYKPAEFVATALQQSKIKLTWDEPDQKRAEVIRRALTSDEIKDMDLQAYIASSSDEEDGEATKSKYAALLGELREQDEGSKEEQGMEISFEPGLREKAEEALKRKKAREAEEDMTVWDKYLDKRKQKKKERKRALKEKNTSEDDDMAGREDDPFFNEDVFGPEFYADGKVPKKDGKGKGKGKVGKEDAARQKKEEAELELLLMDDNNEAMEKRHFNMKDIVKADKQQAKKKGKKGQEQAPDTFNIDVKDDRFAAMFEHPDFAVDPTDQHFKSTTAMKTIMEERQKRAKSKTQKQGQREADGVKGAGKKDGSLSVLVESIKRKSTGQQAPAFGKRRKTDK